MLPLWTRIDLGAMEIKGYFIFPKIIEALLSDCLMLYLGCSLEWGGAYLSAKMQSVYSTAPADLATDDCMKIIFLTEILVSYNHVLKKFKKLYKKYIFGLSEKKQTMCAV